MQSRQIIVSKPITRPNALLLNGGWKTLTSFLPTGFVRPRLVWLSGIVLLLLAHAMQAQPDSFMPSGRTRTDSSRGYWRLQTQAATRSTRVQFYGQNHQLLYEEILSEKWVHLSRKNQKQFDRLLAQLVANQLLASRIRTESMPLTPDVPTPPRRLARLSTDPGYVPTPASYVVHASMSQAGKLYLIVDNPGRLRYTVSVIDQRGRSIYKEFTNHDRYRRRLDVSAVPDAAYQLVVLIDDKPFVYNVSRRSHDLTYGLQPQPTRSQQASAAPDRRENTSLSMPVRIDL